MPEKIREALATPATNGYGSLMTPEFGAREQFPQTRWTLVARAGEGSDSDRQERAVNELCTIYWPTIYAFLRSKGHSTTEAEDLTQGFFEDFLGRSHFAAAEQGRGKLRSYLLKSVSNFAKRSYRDGSRIKRGGGQPILSLDLRDEDGQLVVPEPSDDVSPELAFRRQWAKTVLSEVIKKLRREYEEKGKVEQFDALRFTISVVAEPRTYKEVATDLGSSEGAVKVAVHSLRERYQRVLRETIGDTLLPGEEIDDELRELISAFD